MRNRKHETTVQFWNVDEQMSSGGTREGVDSITKVDKSILIMDMGTDVQSEDYGTVLYETLLFQISKNELGSFNFETGNTHFEYDDKIYFLDKIVDYSDYPKTQLYECTGLREIKR